MPAIWSLSDLHLSFGVPEKSMEVFGPQWQSYTKKIEENWRSQIDSNDLVLIAGDISWAIRLDDALIDLQWIDQLPGRKIMIKGNHDYWWTSKKKVKSILPSSIEILQNDSLLIDEIAFGGTRLWDTDEYQFNQFITFQENPRQKEKNEEIAQEELQQKIFERELERLRLSLRSMHPDAKKRICMTHYPPISHDLKESSASKILEEFHIAICVFGHLHNLKENLPFGTRNGVKYMLTSCDAISFKPVKVWEY